jgi:hypothetical protein
MIYKRIVSLIKRLLNKDLWFQKFIDIPTFRDSDMETTIGHHTICARSAGQKHNLRGDEADHIAVNEAAFVTRELTSFMPPQSHCGGLTTTGLQAKNLRNPHRKLTPVNRTR